MSQTPTQRARVIFLSASVGAGHHHAARAVQTRLEQLDPTLETLFVDALDHVRPPFRLYYAGGYTAMVTRLPWLYGLGYHATDRPDAPGRPLPERARLQWEWTMLAPLRRWLAEQAPALVVCSHYLPAPMVARMIRQGQPGLRQMVIVTDNELHRWWYSEGVERYFVPVEAVRERLLGFGIAGDRIEITGIPVHPKWRAELDSDALRRQWDLPAERPAILLTGGVNFTIGRIDRIAAQLLERLPDMTLVALAGSNKRLLRDLSALPAARGERPRLRVLGYTDRIHELVQLASLVVTKPGGLMTSECLAKGTPMLLMKPVPGQEAANARWLSAEGAAVVAEDSDQIIAQAGRLLDDPPALAELARNARRLDKPAGDRIAHELLEYVNGWRDF